MAKKAVVKKSRVNRVTQTSTPPITLPVTSTPQTPSPRLSPKFLTLGLVVIALALGVYKFGPWLVPAMVNQAPITRFSVWSRLEKTYGAQVLDDLVNEKILDNAIRQAGIVVDDAKIKTEIENLEAQFKDLGGLDEALTQRGLTRAELEKQVRTQLAVEELLADKITPTADEIKAEFEANYADKKFEDVQAAITNQLRESKLRDAFLSWFAEVKKTAKVKSFGL